MIHEDALCTHIILRTFIAVQAPDGETMEAPPPPPPPSSDLDGEPLGPDDVPPPPDDMPDDGIEEVRKNLFGDEPRNADARASSGFPVLATDGPWARAVDEQKRLLLANSEAIMSIRYFSQFPIFLQF